MSARRDFSLDAFGGLITGFAFFYANYPATSEPKRVVFSPAVLPTTRAETVLSKGLA
jgi:hypothetical protein